MSTCIRAGATFKRHVYGKDRKTCKKCGHVKGIFSGEATERAEGEPSNEATQITVPQPLIEPQPQHIDGCDCMDCRNPNT
jgi:hypothetical protein